MFKLDYKKRIKKKTFVINPKIELLLKFKFHMKELQEKV